MASTQLAMVSSRMTQSLFPNEMIVSARQSPTQTTRKIVYINNRPTIKTTTTEKIYSGTGIKLKYIHCLWLYVWWKANHRSDESWIGFVFIAVLDGPMQENVIPYVFRSNENGEKSLCSDLQHFFVSLLFSNVRQYYANLGQAENSVHPVKWYHGTGDVW